MSLTEVPENSEVFEALAEGKMYANDWETDAFNSQTVIDDALAWLVVGETEFVRDDGIFADLFEEK
jgi:hypothetical protein